ncbi:MAG TPA: lysophospholipid acyltransferase family protein [Thermoleophilaceae bacterium]|jgi:1-acyl-sn-glycerol-3-phosphate acyltransferase
MDLDRHHERIRARGVQPLVYWVVRAVLQPAILVWFRLARLGREHVPREGAVILAANHKSFLDPFVVGVCLRRPVYFVAKRELFEKRLTGWFLNCLGAFPIRRGESDEEAVETAKAVLARGDAVVIFPEGTRVRRDGLGDPKRGVGRLALQTGAPVVPIAVHGTERARRGWWIRPVKVRVRCGRPLTFPRVEADSPRLAAEVTARIWPCVELQYRWLDDLPALRERPPLVPRPALAPIRVLSRGGRREDDERRRAA